MSHGLLSMLLPRRATQCNTTTQAHRSNFVPVSGVLPHAACCDLHPGRHGRLHVCIRHVVAGAAGVVSDLRLGWRSVGAPCADLFTHRLRLLLDSDSILSVVQQLHTMQALTAKPVTHSLTTATRQSICASAFAAAWLGGVAVRVTSVC